MKGDRKKKFIEQIVNLDLTIMTVFPKFSYYHESEIRKRADTYITKSIPSISSNATDEIRNHYVKIELEKLELDKKLLYLSWETIMNNWSEVLPLEIKKELEVLVGGASINDLYPTMVANMVLNTMNSLVHRRGMDASIERYFLSIEGSIKGLQGLEVEEDRITDETDEDLKMRIEHEFSQSLLNELKSLKNCLELYKKNEEHYHNFQWDIDGNLYHQGLIRMEPTGTQSVRDRDVQWIPTYLRYIEDHVSSYLKKGFIVHVGYDHAYAMLQTLAKQRHLIKSISRYHSGKGWTPLAFKRDTIGPYFD